MSVSTTVTEPDKTTTDLAAPATAPQPRRSRARWRPRLHHFVQLCVIVVLLASWELSAGRLIDDLLTSRPSEVFPTFWSWVVSGELLYHASSTFKDAFLGLLAGGGLGLVVGCVLGQSQWLARVCEPFITAFYTMPKHALIPLFIMWVGIGSELRVLTAAAIVFFLVFYNTFFGIRDVSKNLVDSVRVMGGTAFDVLFRVMLPSALIWVFAALKLAVPQAIVGVVVAEMLAGDRGLGFLVAMHAGTFNSDGTFAAIFALLIVGFLVDRLMNLVTRRALLWKNNDTTA